jgi:hypothetical protein
MFLIAIGLFGLISVSKRFSLESQRLKLENQLADWENRVNNLPAVADSDKSSAAIDRIKAPLEKKYETVQPRDEATLSILPLLNFEEGQDAIRLRMYIPNSHRVYLKYGVVAMGSYPSFSGQGSMVFTSGVIDESVGNSDIDFDKLPAADWLNRQLISSEWPVPKLTGPYELALPPGICDIELRISRALQVFVNNETKLTLPLVPENTLGFSSRGQRHRINSQRDYPLNAGLPRLFLSEWNDEYQSALWLSTQESDFAPFPGAEP